jgi:hypothetical protein
MSKEQTPDYSGVPIKSPLFERLERELTAMRSREDVQIS